MLAYHLLVSIEKMHRDRGIHTSCATLPEELSTRQVVTVVLPTTSGATLKIRKCTTPEASQREIHRTLDIPDEVMEPVRTVSNGDSQPIPDQGLQNTGDPKGK